MRAGAHLLVRAHSPVPVGLGSVHPRYTASGRSRAAGRVYAYRLKLNVGRVPPRKYDWAGPRVSHGLAPPAISRAPHRSSSRWSIAESPEPPATLLLSHIFADQPMSSLPTSPGIIYLGLDVQKDSVTIAVLPAGATAPTRIDKYPNDFAKLRRVFERHAKDGEIRATGVRRYDRSCSPSLSGMSVGRRPQNPRLENERAPDESNSCRSGVATR